MNFFLKLFSSPKKKLAEPEKRLYVIDVLCTHRIRYVIESTEDELHNVVTFNNTDELTEFSQEHLGDNIVSYRRIDGINNGKDSYLKLFDQNNDYLKSWTPEQKYNLINRK